MAVCEARGTSWALQLPRCTGAQCERLRGSIGQKSLVGYAQELVSDWRCTLVLIPVTTDGLFSGRGYGSSFFLVRESVNGVPGWG